MGKGRPRAVERGVLGHGYAGATSHPVSGGGAATIPSAPIFYPTDEDFKDPLEYINKIRPQAEPYGICRIVPPKSWSPPFARDLRTFTFPTKTQAIHRLQARPPSFDSATFDLEYTRFLGGHLGKKGKKKLIFDGEELDLCQFFNAVKRHGGYAKVCGQKRWGDVASFMVPGRKISECSKHVLCQMYREHLFEYEEYLSKLSFENRKCRGREHEKGKSVGRKKRRKLGCFEEIDVVMNEGVLDLDQICEQCRSGLHGDVMLLCDRCDKGWHLYCLSPPLDRVPSGNWYCLECVNSDKDSFGFVPGKEFSLEDFKRVNDRIRRRWFGQGKPSKFQIEKLFWEIVEGKAGELEVVYGSDLDTSVHGSGFPRSGDPVLPTIEVDVWKKYESSPWNLNNLPKLQSSMLRVIHDNIAGVMVPWLYVGMLFSSFCWHVEDHCFYSINYLHWGEPKCWYGVPGRKASAFEQVMRSTLPDLFDAQPDLLFQLVTMLNPAILQESSIPVYSVMQEPGNFVVTFPKAFHAGFNFGLNCAEAVNFAPADWLPHGRFGAELYRLYRKPAVFSHEELLCVVAKNVIDSKALPYLKDELCRICISEKNNREEVWKNGIVKSSLMTMKKHPLYVGTEEDHTCIICRQYLYLSAISCSCRTTTFVCLKHWKHLCECDSSHHQLLYRHTLAELDDLITMTSSMSHVPCLGTPQHLRSQQSTLSPQFSITKLKKVKGGQVTLSELAEDWHLKASNLFEIPFSNDDFAAIMSEAEQFLWAGHDMDKVRNVATKLIDAQKWALSVKDCLFRVDTFSYSEKDGIDKISLNQIEELLSIDPVPCYEPGHLKLEAYADDAKKLIAEIRTALSSRLDIGKVEIILSKAMEFPVDIKETKILETELSSAKIWMSNVREFFKETSTAIDIGFLNSLKLEMLELRIQLQEMDLLANFSREVDLLHFRCKEILKRPLKLKFTELDNFLKDADKVRVSIPELDLLKDFHLDACSWSRDFHDIMNNLPDREDYENIVVELSGILESGNLLRIEVDELQLVEVELQRSRCREKATKALQHRIPFEFIEEVLVEASLLEIKSENCFVKLAKVESEAILWEKKASYVLTNGGSLSEFEDILRASEHVLAFLPSLPEIKDAISMAQTWISRSQPYLIDSRHTDDGSGPLLSIEDLKELVKLSRNLKVNLVGPERLEKNLNAIYEWEHNTCLLEEDTMTLFKEACSNFTTVNNLILRIVDLLTRANSAIKIGISMYVALGELPKLQQATLTLQWSLDALSFCTRTPLDKDIDKLLEDAHHLPIMFSGCSLVQMLVNGANLLRKGLLTLSGLQNSKRCLLKEVDEVLGEIQKSVIPYPSMVARLQNAIRKHNSWTMNVHKFFSQLSKKCWASLVELEEQGQSDAFDCPELAMVASEVGKVKKWMLKCHACVKPLIGNIGTLSMELIKIKDSLHKALSIYRSLNGSWTKTFSLCCSNDSESDCTYTCISCGNRYHFSCMSPRCTSNNYSCSFCISMETESGVQNGVQALVFQGNRPEFRSFAELVSSAERFYPGIQEVTLLQEIVELAKECRFQLYVVVDHANSHYNDFNTVSKKLVCALKATSIAGLYDYEGGCNLQIALSRHSWKVRVKLLMSGVKKSTVQAIQHLEKEGLEMGIPYEDQLMLELTQLKQTSLQWLDVAKKVASDSGEIALSRVFELINEGELLPVKFDVEMKLLKNRSILYCICRKPDDRRPMIACDQCDEWYHFDCLNLHEEPCKTFFCPACKPCNGELISLPHPAYHDERSCGSEGEPQTPACHESKRREQPGTVDSCLEGNAVDAVEEGDFLKCCSEIDYFWRVRRRPLQRASKKHRNLGLGNYWINWRNIKTQSWSCYIWGSDNSYLVETRGRADPHCLDAAPLNVGRSLWSDNVFPADTDLPS